MAGPRGPAALTAPVLSGTPVIGSTLTIAPGTWSRPTTVLYTLLRAGVPVSGFIKVAKATIEARPLLAVDIVLALVVREHSLVGGGYADSAPLSLWSPLTLADVLQYHDAVSLASMGISGGEATKWDDLGPRTNNLAAASASSAVYPAYQAAGLGTGPCLLFDGVGEWLRIAAAAYGGTVGTYSLAMCGDQISMGANQICVSYGASNRPSLIQRTNQLRHTGAGGTAQNSVTNPTTAGLWIATWDGANQNLYLNGALEVGPTANVGAALADGGQFSVGAGAGGASFANESLGLVLFTRGVMTGGEMTLLRAYCTAMGWP